MSAAREHQQTMASVVLGCRDVTKAGRAAGAVREHRLADRVSGCQGCCSSPGKGSSPGRAHHRAGAAVSACRDHQGSLHESKAQQSTMATSAPSCHRQAQSPAALVPPLCPGLLAPVLAIQECLRSHRARLAAGAPSRRSLRQHPHGCQSSRDNELLMCLKSDAGCMARS